MIRNITQSFIFAAGRGERMRPLTDTTPKPLIKVKGKSIIDYGIEKLNKISSLKTIIINGFYLADQVEAHIKELNNPKIIFSREVEKIETGGALVFARDKINFDEPLLAINGDVLWEEKGDVDIEILRQNFDETKCDILLGLKKTEEFSGYEGRGDFNFDAATGKLSRALDENEKMDYVFVGLQIINPKIINNVTEKCFSMSYFYKNAFQKDGSVKGILGLELSGTYFHVGDAEGLRIAETHDIK